MKTPLTMGKVEWFLLIVLSALWGGSFFFAKIALLDIPPLTLVIARVGIAAIALFALLIAMGRQIPSDPKLWAMFAVMGLFNNLIPFCLLFWGQTHIGAGLASIFNAMAPVFTVVVAHFWLSDERLTGGKIIGVLLGLVGASLMIGIDIKNGLGFWVILAMIGCLLAALSYGFASVYGRRFSANDIEPFTVAFGQLATTTVMMAPVVCVIDHPWALTMPSMASLYAVAILALVCTALGYVLFFRILASGGATNISLVAFLIPISAILLSSTFLDERFSFNHFAGIGLIFIGLSALDGRLWKWTSDKFEAWNTQPEPPMDLMLVKTANHKNAK